MKGKLKEIPGHEGFGRPAQRLVLSEEVACSACGTSLNQGDNVWFSFKDAGVYCKDCGFPSFKSKIDSANGERRVACHVELAFLTGKDRKQVKQDVLSDYEGNDLEKPSGEQLESLVDKRMKSENSERQEFLDEAKSLGAIIS